MSSKLKLFHYLLVCRICWVKHINATFRHWETGSLIDSLKAIRLTRVALFTPVIHSHMSLSPLGDKPMPLSQCGSTHDTVTLKWPGIKKFKRHKMQTHHWSNPHSSCTSLCCITWHVLHFYSKLLLVTEWKACLLEMAVLFMPMPTWCALHWKPKKEKKSRMNEMQKLRKNVQIIQIHLHAKIPILIFFFLKGHTSTRLWNSVKILVYWPNGPSALLPLLIGRGFPCLHSFLPFRLPGHMFYDSSGLTSRGKNNHLLLCLWTYL